MVNITLRRGNRGVCFDLKVSDFYKADVRNVIMNEAAEALRSEKEKRAAFISWKNKNGLKN